MTRHVARHGTALAAGALWLGILLAGSGAGAAGAAGDRPPEVLSWRHQVLPRERYAELAGQWEAWVKEHPRDARALVELGDATRYSGKWEEASEIYARAFAADSNDVAAIASLCSNEASRIADPAHWQVIQDRLVRAEARDPSYPDLLYTLWLSSMRTGDGPRAETCLRRMVELGDMPRALYDYGYNMLAGAPADAIVFTNGDNDTYPPLAVQAVTGFRRDVSIVNLSLLNTTWYIRWQRDHGVPVGLDDAAVEALEPTREALISAQVAGRIAGNLRTAASPRPLLYSVTVPPEARKLEGCRMVLEGLLERVVPAGPGSPEGPDVDRDLTRELIDTAYRLDSSSDPSADWVRESSVARLCWNYVDLLVDVGNGVLEQEDPAGGTYLYRAVAIVTAQREGEKARGMLDAWELKDPGSKLLGRARALASGEAARH